MGAGRLQDKAVALRAWSPGVIHGLLQTEGYAQALLETAPGATGEMVATRLKARMERQQRVVMRDDPPTTWFVVDELSLYRCVGSSAVMAGQLRHVTDVARRPNVTLQVLPAVAHPAGASGFIVTDTAAYAEHVAGGFTYSDPETVSSLLRLFNTIHSESYRASESLRLIERLAATWTGGSPLTQTPMAGTA
jgi:hypothetical protein